MTHLTEADAYSRQKKCVAYEKQLKKVDAVLLKSKGDRHNAMVAYDTAKALLAEREQDWSAKIQDTQAYEVLKGDRYVVLVMYLS